MDDEEDKGKRQKERHRDRNRDTKRAGRDGGNQPSPSNPSENEEISSCEESVSKLGTVSAVRPASSRGHSAAGAGAGAAESTTSAHHRTSSRRNFRESSDEGRDKSISGSPRGSSSAHGYRANSGSSRKRDESDKGRKRDGDKRSVEREAGDDRNKKGSRAKEESQTSFDEDEKRASVSRSETRDRVKYHRSSRGKRTSRSASRGSVDGTDGGRNDRPLVSVGSDRQLKRNPSSNMSLSIQPLQRYLGSEASDDDDDDDDNDKRAGEHNSARVASINRGGSPSRGGGHQHDAGREKGDISDGFGEKSPDAARGSAILDAKDSARLDVKNSRSFDAKDNESFDEDRINTRRAAVTVVEVAGRTDERTAARGRFSRRSPQRISVSPAGEEPEGRGASGADADEPPGRYGDPETTGGANETDVQV